MHKTLLLMLLVLPFAGCLGDDADEATTPGGPDGDAGIQQTAHFLDIGLTYADEAAGSVTQHPLGWSWLEWSQDIKPPTWTLDAWDHDVRVTSARAEIWYEAMAPALGHDLRTELTTWFGVDDGRISHRFFDGPTLLAPGDRALAEFDFSVPVGGLVVRAGEQLQLSVASYYLDAEAVPLLAALTGGDAPSNLHLTWHAEEPTPVGAATHIDFDGQVIGMKCVQDVDPGTAVTTTTFQVPEGSTGLQAYLGPMMTLGHPDLDFHLFGPDGEPVGGGHGPGSTETLWLDAHNLETAGFGTWTANVYACGPQASSFSLDVDVFAAP